ncbi:M23 family metallopeptidase [Cryobacterium sp. CG_9.6]|uniref:M23 family metallopeptidase n=1 Tax=Cryobacterium sp. CG_9.6 TaxID=2760710 RepID=UPI0024769269|nr:M23 family metallopeptidase [Cryobacterium sp. CG_9.6]MDH6237866.1 murein DD-endopeptidase MepM/ murein hydrolase activator NlpD [Cryobacterium sp. CG_9.6]
MTAVGFLTVATALPAVAANSAMAATSTSSFATPPTSADESLATQSVTISASATKSPQRDGYTVTETPQFVAPTSVTTNRLSSQGWTFPVVGGISSPYGARPNKPVSGVGDFHNGTDIAATCGKPVSAVTSGTVVQAGYLGSYGNWVLIDHGDGIQTGYAHNSRVLVSKGQTVTAGEKIAVVGSTGASSGCHVHFETRINDTQVDPVSFMTLRGVLLG